MGTDARLRFSICRVYLDLCPLPLLYLWCCGHSGLLRSEAVFRFLRMWCIVSWYSPPHGEGGEIGGKFRFFLLKAKTILTKNESPEKMLWRAQHAAFFRELSFSYESINSCFAQFPHLTMAFPMLCSIGLPRKKGIDFRIHRFLLLP